MAVANQPESQTTNSIPLAQVEVEKPIDSGILSYPFDMNEKQDRIRFEIKKVKKIDIADKTLKSGATSFTIISDEVNYESVPNSSVVYLPIQSGISDTNAVEWGGGQLNELERFIANTSLIAMSGGYNAVGEQLQNALNSISTDQNYFKGLLGAGQIALAEMATGTQGLLSRVTGNVLNPNLELLFRGPTLRPFQFQFKLSPRSKKEADRVKTIINYFKKYMAVQTNNELFLRAPYVFSIQYQHSLSGVGEPHQSIGLIKPCALQAFNVDYTPLGSYMTFDDDEATMVSYNISMQFQEIVPITSSDYKVTIPNKPHPIGY